MNDDLKSFIEDYNRSPLVIGELGINHQGSLEIARELISGAARAGVHAVKFQYRNLLKSYSSESREIGDEIVKTEIERNYLSPEAIMSLVSEAQGLGMWVGISFFIVDDCADFGTRLNEFDFFKIPSVELTNTELINFLVSTKKPVLISTGAHWEREIEKAFSEILGENWYPLHCVSNYPLAPHNSNFSYIAQLRERWNRPVGYSSHESDWEFVLIALKYKPRVIERHLTLDKSLPGLDQTTSSDLTDFAKMVRVLDCASKDEISQILSRVPNQGELLNRQNLGRSYYFVENQNKGQVLDERNLAYRSPQIGINKSDLKALSSKVLVADGVQNGAVLPSHFQPKVSLSIEDITFANKLRLALPVRLHDFEQVQSEIPVDSLELHLSYSEIDKLVEFSDRFNNQSLSLHLPDYINPLQLIDPISDNPDIRIRSWDIIRKVVDFVSQVQEKNGYQVLIVGSFPVRTSISRELYYDKYAAIQSSLRNNNIMMTMQWLPPFAWYFGGSEQLDVLNSEMDLGLINQFGIDVCMDISHLLLGANYFHFNPKGILQNLKDRIKFYHLSDAVGIDGEGSHFDLDDSEKRDLFRQVLKVETRKTIEVWQGHFDHCSGFKRAIRDLRLIQFGETNDAT